MGIKELQRKLLGIIGEMLVIEDNETIKAYKQEAINIVGELKDHINDSTEIDDKTILDLILQTSFRVSPDYVEKRGLAEIEKAVKAAGGRTMKEVLEKRSEPARGGGTRVVTSNSPVQANRSVQEIGDEYDRVNRRIEELAERPLPFRVTRGRSGSV
ncbi:hypothetical protein [Wolbachia endosymbiont of Folsomia candida]|uniref:hypothetical protein n=1 Tax=Wolbachia endosymbiont of Folsomia candida TaxID=169402 RepID=UPI000AB4776A|nr:hypothetical protein [Wolbachia endosymbiont of Folsomia candida]APR98863.1 hypothetical protein ASM33_06605 [Wolbachia endosymbiont of Folsomia candida]